MQAEFVDSVTGSCKMILSISYLVYSVNYLVYSTRTNHIGVGSKFEVQRPCCAARRAAKKMKSNFAAHSAVANFLKVCTFRLQNNGV